MQEQVILVNKKDQPIGLMDKLEAHEKGALHRAVSVFIFNSDNQLLIQRRSLEKYHTPGIWSNTACSHPRNNESTISCANRRLLEEMGMITKIKPIFSFLYKFIQSSRPYLGNTSSFTFLFPKSPHRTALDGPFQIC